jgi:ribosomal protein L18
MFADLCLFPYTFYCILWGKGKYENGKGRWEKAAKVGKCWAKREIREKTADKVVGKMGKSGKRRWK